MTVDPRWSRGRWLNWLGAWPTGRPSPPKKARVPRQRRQGDSLTVADVAARYRVGPDKVRGWIRNGQLKALNVSSGKQKSRFVITPEALAEFEGRKAVAPAEAPKPARRKPTTGKDWFPD